MHIYRANPPEKDGDWVQPVCDVGFDILHALSSHSVLEEWQPLDVRIFRTVDGDEVRTVGSLMPWLSSDTLVFRDRTIDELGSALENFGELLPLRHSEARLSLLHVLGTIDALDEESSQITRFPGSRKVLNIERHSFRPGVIPRMSIFRLASAPRLRLYFTEDMVNHIESYGYGGTEFSVVGEVDL